MGKKTAQKIIDEVMETEKIKEIAWNNHGTKKTKKKRAL
jgi:methyltransferase-like protein